MNEIFEKWIFFKTKKKGENKLMLHLPPLSHTHMLTSNHPKKIIKPKKKNSIYTQGEKKKKGNKRKSVEQKNGDEFENEIDIEIENWDLCA